MILLEKRNDKGRLLPTTFEDKDKIVSVLRQNPNGYSEEDYFKALDFITSVLDVKLPANNDKEQFVGRCFEVNFFNVANIEFTNSKLLARSAGY